MRSGLEAGRLSLGLQWQFSYASAQHGVDEEQFEPGIADDAQARTHVTDLLFSDWSFTARLGLSSRVGIELLVPLRLVDVDASFLDDAGNELEDFTSIHHRDETLVGLGDVMLRHRYRLLRQGADSRATLDLLVGLTFPTGSTEPNPFELGRARDPHQHMFFGTGTVNPLGGLDSSYAFDSWTLLGWASVRAGLFENEFGYRGPTQVAGGVGARTGFGLDDWSFLLGPEIYFETPAQWSGEDAENSGRVDVIGTAGVFWTPSERVATHLVVKVPVTVRSEGGQLRMPVVVGLGASYAFDLWGSDRVGPDLAP